MGRVDPNQPSVADDPNDELAARRRLNEQHPGPRVDGDPRATPPPAAPRPPGGATRVANPLLVGYETDVDTDDQEVSESEETAAAPSLGGAGLTRSTIANTAATVEIPARRVATPSRSPKRDVAATLPTGATRARRVALLPVGAIVALVLVIATVAVLYETGKVSFSGGPSVHALTTPSRAPHTSPTVSTTARAAQPLLAALRIRSAIQIAGRLVHASAVKAEAARSEQAHRRAVDRDRRHRKKLAHRRAQGQNHPAATTSTPTPATTYTPSTSTSAAATATSATTTPTYTPTTPSYTPPAQTSAPATSSSSSQPAGPTGAGTQSGGCDPICK
jgi:hypothetical protein